MKIRQLLTVLVAVFALFTISCGSSETTVDTATDADQAQQTSSQAAGDTNEKPTDNKSANETTADETASDSASDAGAQTDSAYPVTFKNCGIDVTIEKEPQRIVVLNSSPVVALSELGLMDRVVARGGHYPEAYYSETVNSELAQIPEMTSTSDSTGHLIISLESVLEQEPDVVFGSESETITRDGLAKTGAVLFVDPSFCKGDTPLAAYENIYSTIETYGQVFNKQAEAAAYIDGLKERVQDSASQPALEPGSTAAALYVESDGGKIWAYGPKSMTHPQMLSLGASNVFDDLEERVVDVSIEELIERDPQMLILLHSDPENSDEDVLEMFLAMPGADKIAAVKNGQAFPHLFNFSEPATPLVIDGLDMLKGRLDN